MQRNHTTMKYLISLTFLIVSSFCFSQSNGMIVGKVLDGEFDNNPLIFADVSIKETGIKLATDQTGLFVVENLEDGDYTLVCSFIGYETKELQVKVVSGISEDINISLIASAISIGDLTSIASNSDKVSKSSITQ